MEQQKMPPGFRFSPTDEELVVHYLRNRACGRDYHQGTIAEVDIYKHEPWDLPEKSALSSPDPVWYFFNAQDKRHSHSARINRTTSKGYWKATGKDRKICSGPLTVGIKKTLIYYEGRAPSGKRTDWIMHEYKLDEDLEKRSKAVCSAALCRIRKKGGPGPRNGEQFGAPVFNENGEWGEDVDDDVDEKFPLPSASSEPDQVEVFEKVLLDPQTQVRALNDLPHAEGVDTNTELDLDTFLETFFTDNAEVASLEADMVPVMPAMDSTQMGQYNFTRNTSHGVYAPSDVESLLGLDGTNVHDILHPTCNEEEILGELLHLTDGSQCHTNTPDCNERILFQVPIHTNGNPYPHDNLYPDGAGSSGDFDEYIEMNDMNSPLDGFVLRSPSYYGTDNQQQQLPSDLFDDMEAFGWSPDSLNTQGSATRRVRLQIRPPLCATQQQTGAMHKFHSEVPVSSGITIQIGSTSYDNGQKLVNASSGSGSDSGDMNGWASSKSSAAKHVAGAKCEELHSFAATTDLLDEECLAFKINMVKVHPNISNAVSFSPSLLNTSACIQEASVDCDAGLDTDGGSFDFNTNTRSSHTQEAGLDCEAGPSSRVSGESFELVHTNREVGQLVSKVKALTLSNRLVELESNLSTTFNEKVFALGKPVARLFPSKDYTNPYRSLRSGAMWSLCHLGLAVLVLFFLFLAIHMLTKYVLSLAA